eukprot:349747-Chlamydomonas_euryale.AAC.3
MSRARVPEGRAGVWARGMSRAWGKRGAALMALLEKTVAAYHPPIVLGNVERVCVEIVHDSVGMDRCVEHITHACPCVARPRIAACRGRLQRRPARPWRRHSNGWRGPAGWMARTCAMTCLHASMVLAALPCNPARAQCYQHAPPCPTHNACMGLLDPHMRKMRARSRT